jgi:hypothetical protein
MTWLRDTLRNCKAGQELCQLYASADAGTPHGSDRVTFLSHCRRPQGRKSNAGDRIRLLKQIVDGLDETSQGRRFRRRGPMLDEVGA